MSLLQRALDRAENPETETVTKETVQAAPKIPAPEKKAQETSSKTQHDAPRLNAIRFYEAQNQAIEEDIRQAKAVSVPKQEVDHSGRNRLFLITALLTASLGLIPFLHLPAPKNKPLSAQKSAVETPQTVIVKAEKPFVAKPVSQIRFMLTGITASGDTMLAVINNQVVGTGDKLREGATVKSITDNRVVLDLDGRQIVLNF